jgi:two-component system, OmpR family, heavy metal sensor histidine kinase CusS
MLSADVAPSETTGPVARHVSLRPTLSGRLVAIIFTTAFGLILAASSLLYWGTVQVLMMADDQVIVKRMNTVAQLFEAPVLDVGQLGHELSEDNQGPRQIFLRVLTPGADVMLETPGMQSRLPSAVFPALKSAKSDAIESATIESPRGDSYRAAVKHVHAKSDGFSGGVIIQAATDTSLDRQGLTWLQRLLACVIGAALPISALASWLLVKRSLEPLHRFAAEAQAIDGTTIGKRLPLEGLPRELHNFGTQFNAMLGRLEDTWNELKHYADGIAHEMRTPLNRLRLRSEIALRDDVSADDLRAVMANNVEECERLTRVLQALLFLARADSKQASIAPQWLDIRAELKTIAEYFEGSANASGIVLETNLPSDIKLFADRTLLQRAVGNLLSNAVAHTPAGGRIILSAEETRAGETVISVQDTGRGIAPEHQGRIFDRFYRATLSDRKGSPGIAIDTCESDRLGLGLSITKSIVTLHNGRITLDSTPGSGALFKLWFPRRS